ncbi:hypothetical protein FHW83_000547 [Duganella sp. SG902]|uniref:hypothetical protein n=1 Tax=Duganella sp. SG902 TaxID=2587016 RepID=UPI00159E1B2E|nr:hypothetical protein [Duganella sp. SG902]NVM74787.1 hypothetical protein [Duganella sp. SG902]
MELRVLGNLTEEGLEVVERQGRFFVRYDAGSHQTAWREDQISNDELVLLKQGGAAEATAIIGLQRRIRVAGEDPNIQNWSPPDA